MANISAIKLPDGVTYNVKDNVSGYITGMTILSYGSSTWQNFIDAYDANKVVYCRASSNSNPATGSQTRLAFMAYVNNATTPTEVEFQYYRSVSSHSASQQGDQVYIYKLNKSTGWSVTVREAMSKIAAGGDLTSSYANGTITISGDIPTVPTNVSAFTNDAGYITGYTETDPIFTASAAHGISSSDITNWNNKSNFSGSYNDLTNKPTIPTISPNTVMWDENMSGSGEHGGELFYTTTGLDAEFLTDNALYENGNTVLQSTDLKTVNNTSLIGSGNVAVQPTLVSGINIKTVNGNSLLGSGDLTIQSGGSKNVWFGFCTTTLAASEKVVTTTSGDFELADGNIIIVNFSKTVIGSPKLNVDGTGAVDIYYYDDSERMYQMHSTIAFVYDEAAGDDGGFVPVNRRRANGSSFGLVAGNEIPHDISQISLTVANWNATTTCTKSVTGVTASNSIIVSPAPASIADYVSAGVYCSAQGSGTLTFTASSTPTADLVVNVMVVG